MSTKARDFWMALHRYSGLVILVFLAFAALTGSLLVYLRPLDAAINADLFRQAPAQDPAPVAQLVDRFRAAHPEYAVRSFPLAVAADARIPVKVDTFAARADSPINQVFLDRETGALVASRSDEPALDRRGAARLLHDIHYTLMLGDGGRWFMGLVAFAWLVSNFVGLYLTFPARGAFWKQWKRTWRFRFASPFPRLMMDLHRSAGLWLFVPLTAIALTSVCMNFFEEGYAPVVERLVPEPDLPLPRLAPGGPLDFASAAARARTVAGASGERWLPATVLYTPAENRIGVTLTDDGLLRYTDLGPIYLWFDAASGTVVEVTDPYHGDANLAMYRWLYPVHSGHIAGLWTELLVVLTGLVTFALCVTGIYLWWKKRPARAMRRTSAKGGPR